MQLYDYRLNVDGIDQELIGLMRELFPICRSITGNGLRESLKIIQRHIPLELHEVPTGTQVLDWTVPREWNIRDAWIKGPDGQKIVDFRQCNVHVMSYSTPVHQKMPLEELKAHLYTLPDYPDWVPYLTTYYSPRWGFCVSHRQFESLPPGEYEVMIDASLEDGALTYGELYLPGESEEEILFSTYLCHPSMCNDNLSGPVVQTFLARQLMQQEKRRYSYRFLFIPETIGAITWLARNEDRVEKIRYGMILTCCGDAGLSTYKKTRDGNTFLDRAVEKVLLDSGEPYKTMDFSLGSDERQFSSPGFNMAVGTLMRTPYAEFPQYHTAADNLDLMSPEALANTLMKHLNVVYLLENNRKYYAVVQKGEPQLGRRGLYTTLGGQKDGGGIDNFALFWLLNLSDGRHDAFDVACRSKIDFGKVKRAADLLVQAELLYEIGEAETAPNLAGQTV